MRAEQVDTLALGSDMLKTTLRAGQAVEIKSFGFSMWPVIQDASLVHIEPCQGEECRPGDIVLFERGRSLVIHRVLRASRSRLLIKGDACFEVDGWVSRERVYGRLERHVSDRAMARFAPSLTLPLGLASVLARRVRSFVSKF